MKKKINDLVNEALVNLEKLQSGDERCREYSLAVTKLEEAIHWLNHK